MLEKGRPRGLFSFPKVKFGFCPTVFFTAEDTDLRVDVGLRNRSNAAATVRPVPPAGPPRYPSRHPSFWKHWGPAHLSAIHEAHPQPR